MHLPPFKYLDFYKNYNLEYWPVKISLLKNCYENFEKVKEYIHIELSDPDDDKTLLMLRTDLHYLYFQMVETLFELIFALQNKDEENLWYYLSFSDRNNYNKINDLANGERIIFEEKVTLTNSDSTSKIEIPFLRFVFFHFIDLDKIGFNEKENLQNIERLLKIFAHDFADRTEYNAFKHSLRMTYDKPKSVIQTTDGKHSFTFEGENAFNYLEKLDTDTERGLSLVTKCFFPALDLLLCKYCSWLINNIIVTRKNHYFKTNDPIIGFSEIDFKEIYEIPKDLAKSVQTFLTHK